MNRLQKMASWMFEKAVGFPVWPVSQQMPGAFRQFFGITDGAVTGLSALQLSAVWTCCNLLGRVTSTLPIDVVKSDGGVSRPIDHYISEVLERPNEYMSKVPFWEAMLLSLNLHGNAYAEIVRIGKRITALWPLPFERTRVHFKNRNLLYDVSIPDGTIARFAPKDILHIRNFSIDGINGMSPISASQVIARTMSASKFQTAFLRNGARPSVAFVAPKDVKYSPEAKDRLRESAEKLYTGEENAGRILFMFDGMEPKPFSVSPADAQILEQMRAGSAEIGSMYGVPMYFLNDSQNVPTFASAEQFNRNFVDYGEGPLCVRIQDAVKHSLLASDQGVSIKFNLDALMQGDSISRINYIRTAVFAGVMTPNEGRAKLNLPPKPGGDDLIVQSNNTLLSALEDLASAAAAKPQLSAGGRNVPVN
ncbi:MAG TPA: phage portal protein [Clostridia bacterium]|nr:phage portal protein [Clostridia bacterium]